MRTLDRYLARELVPPFLATCSLLVMVLLLSQAGRLGEAAFGQGMRPLDVIALIAYSVPPFLVFALPIATLLAVLIAVGRMASDRELLAIRASGIALHRLLVVPLLFATMVAGLATVVSHYGEPWGMRSLSALLVDLARRNVSHVFRSGEFNDSFGGLTVYVERVDPDSGELDGILLTDDRLGTTPVTILAESGAVRAHSDRDTLLFDLDRGELHRVDWERDAYQWVRFGREQLEVDIEGEVRRSAQRNIGLTQQFFPDELQEAIDSGHWTGRLQARLEVGQHRRWSLPAAAIVFAFLGFALACQGRAGSHARGFGVGVLAFLVYCMLAQVGDGLGEARLIVPWLAAWFPDLLLLAAAMWPFQRSVLSR